LSNIYFPEHKQLRLDSIEENNQLITTIYLKYSGEKIALIKGINVRKEKLTLININFFKTFFPDDTLLNLIKITVFGQKNALCFLDA
jgi:hypothetical protein